MSQLRCPFCGTVTAFSAAAGQTVTCPACRRPYVAASSAPGQPPGAGTPSVVPMAPVKPAPRPTNMAAPTPMNPVYPGAAAPVQPVRPAATPVAQVVPVSPGVSADDDSYEPSSAGHYHYHRRSSLGPWLAIGFLGGLVFLALGALLMLAAWKRNQPSPPPVATTTNTPTPSHEVTRLTPSNSMTSDWHDITQDIVLCINDIAVGVDFVDFGEVRAKDADNHVIVSGSQRYLQIFLKIKNYRLTPMTYNSWYGNRFSLDGQELGAILVDDQGRQYDIVTFPNVSGVKGHVSKAILENKEVAHDVLVFSLPPAVTPDQIRYFRLELPAVAYGGQGSYRYQIPATVIQGF